MPESYLYLITCSHDVEATTKTLATFGNCALLSEHGTWLVAVDIDKAEADDLHAGSMLESVLDELGEDIAISVVEVNNIATYNIDPRGEQLLDQLFPAQDEEE